MTALYDALTEYQAQHHARLDRLARDVAFTVACYQDGLDGIYRSAGRPYGPTLEARDRWLTDHGVSP